VRLKWHRVFQRSKHLNSSLPDKHLTSANLQQLADTIDDVFFEGAFQRCCRASPKGQARFEVQDDLAATPLYHSCQVAAAYDPNTNTIVFNRPAWQRSPSLAAPVQVDGVYCFSKLEWIAHSVAHEMVHAMVHCLCPTTAQLPAYSQQAGHGPVFRRLNRAFFGHPGYLTTHSWAKGAHDIP
jgi:hypothetical protein